MTAALALVAAGCGDDGPAPGVDAGPGVDAPPAPDAAPADAAPPGDAELILDASIDAVPIDAFIPDAAPPEPTPSFSVQPRASGDFAVTPSGLRPNFILNNVLSPSQIQVTLLEDGASTPCNVKVRPAFVEFGEVSAGSNTFATLILDLGAGTVVNDSCHWDDAYMLSELGALGTIEIGFARPADNANEPAVDVYVDLAWPMPGDADTAVLAGGGDGLPMGDDGVVNFFDVVLPEPGTIEQGLFIWDVGPGPSLRRLLP
ncbi:hypothetical protein [Haliangium ochraceum]|nr:hypothetical protein [Haliangium ochraceum]